MHKYLRHGHLKKVYENGLAHRLKKKGYKVEQQFPLDVFDEGGCKLGDYFADLLVNEYFIVKLKACKALNNDHVAQILGYLRSANQEHGMLINFGASKLQVQKYILSQDI